MRESLVVTGCRRQPVDEQLELQLSVCGDQSRARAPLRHLPVTEGRIAFALAVHCRTTTDAQFAATVNVTVHCPLSSGAPGFLPPDEALQLSLVHSFSALATVAGQTVISRRRIRRNYHRNPVSLPLCVQL